MPEPRQVLEEAKRLRDERFKNRNTLFEWKDSLRHGTNKIEVPSAYKKTTWEYHTPVIEEEGRQLQALIAADPVPHVPPPTPEDQAATTKIEQFLTAAWNELRDHYGPFDNQARLSQIHKGIGTIYFSKKKVPYKGQPKPPKDDASADDVADYADRNDRYKRDKGICAVFEASSPTMATVMPVGNIYRPSCVYVMKKVPERELMITYGLRKTDDGYAKKDDSLLSQGDEQDSKSAESTVEIVEYWDKNECLILVESGTYWKNFQRRKDGFVLDSWKHNKGYVPFWFVPAFMTEQTAEEYKFTGPLDALYSEVESHERLRTIMSNVAYQSGFASYQLLTKESGELIVDDNGNTATFLEFEPGKIRQFAPGQQVTTIPQAPEVAILATETAQSSARIEKYSLSDISKGVSPGADTANSALSSLRRLQRSALQPMADEMARAVRQIFVYMLDCIKELGETVYVYDKKTDTHLSLGPDDIVTTMVDVAVVPDKGQDQLLVEKHAVELWTARAISKIEMYSMMGYENPEQKALEVEVENFASTLTPIVQQQVTATLGMLDAVNAMIQANAETGSAQNAIPGLMQQAQEQQGPTGMGQGSPGQPRENGVRAPALAPNTAAGQANYG